MKTSITWSLGAFGAMLLLYFGILGAISGGSFAISEFAKFWYYVVPLAAGFGVQVGLYARLREVVTAGGASKGVVAASGSVSGAAMVSCCAHYLANIVPVLGASGLVTFAARYQVEFFWIGLLFNAAGIAFVANRLVKAAEHHAHCAPA